MGSKKLKATAVKSDRKEIEVTNSEVVEGLVEEINEHCVIWLIEQTVERKGIGDPLAEGVRTAAKHQR